MKTIQTIKILFRLFSLKRKRQFYQLVVLSIVAGIGEAIFLGSLLPFLAFLQDPQTFLKEISSKFPIISNLINNEILTPFAVIVLIFFLTITLSSILRIFYTFFAFRFAALVGEDSSTLLYKKAIYADYSYYLDKNNGRLISNIVVDSDRVVIGSLSLLNILNGIIMSAVILCVLLTIKPTTTIIVFASIILSYGVVSRLSKEIALRNSKIANKSIQAKLKTLNNSLGVIQEIIINGKAKEFEDIFKSQENKLRTAGANADIISTIPKFIIEAIGVLLLGCVGIFTTIRANAESANTLGILALFAVALQRLLPLAQLTYNGWTGIRSVSASIVDFSNHLSILESYNNSNKAVATNFKYEHSIILSDYLFSYPNSDRIALSCKNLAILKGEVVGIIGKSGAGKSTLIEALMGLIKPEKGKLLIDQENILEQNKEPLLNAWHSRISIVPQKTFLIEGTIASNIAFTLSKEEINEKRARECASLACIMLPNYNSDLLSYEVGENGCRLSGGQKQRIAIARALYKQTDILILDEATSALDKSNESEIINNLTKYKRRMTIIMVTHSDRIINLCDKLIYVDNGIAKEKY